MSAVTEHGLWLTPKDEKDFSLGAIVGHAQPLELPPEYSVGEPIVIKDQGEGTDTCTSYALTAVSEDEEGIALDPDFTFAATKQITGHPEAWGADLRSAAKSAVKRDGLYGFLKCRDISKLTNPQTVEDRNIAADWRNVPDEAAREAVVHAKKSFFAVDGPYDLFDNIRSALWQTRAEKRSVFTGCNWRQSWTEAPGGVIDEAPKEQTYGHAVKAYGWKGGRIHLQLSNGIAIGDRGTFWIGREALNQAFAYGAFTFLDLSRSEAEEECWYGKKHTFFRWIPDFIRSIRGKI